MTRCALFLAVLALAAGGCRRQEPGAVVATDLISVIPFTDTAHEIDVIDLGTPLGDAHLLSGWSGRAPDDSDFVPAESVAYLRRPRARLFFHLAAARPLEVRFRCAALNTRGRPLRVQLRLNGFPLGVHLFDSTMETVAFTPKLAAVEAGRNEILLQAPISEKAPRVIAQRFGAHQKALACESVQIVADASASAPRLRGADGSLMLPAGASVDLFVAQQPDPVVLLKASAPGRVRLDLIGDAGKALEVFDGLLDGGQRRFELPRGGPEIRRLRLTASGAEAVVLERIALEHRALAPAHRNGNAPRPSNVILYIVDTLRADRLGCYGYGRPTSPQIDALARESVLFEDAQAQASWTRPAVASILSGRTPRRHGAVKLNSAIDDGAPMLAEILHAAGFATGAWVTNMNVAPRWGFDRGFDVYRYLEEKEQSPTLYLPAPALHAAALEWILAHRERPFFAYLHATDPHAPYNPSPAFADRFERRDLLPPGIDRDRALRGVMRRRARNQDASAGEWLSSLYDGDVAEFDAALGDFLAALRREKILDDTLLIVVSDHGEEFLEHGALSHGYTLYREQLHVPLLVRFPGAANAGRRIPGLVRQVDILPTVLEHVGLATPPGGDGRSLFLELADDRVSESLRLSLSHTSLGQRELAAATTTKWKVIAGQAGNRPKRRERRLPLEVFDRGGDQAELTNLADRQPDVVGFARQVLAESAAASRQVEATTVPLDDATAERLRALGYLDGN